MANISIHPEDMSEGTIFPEGAYRWGNPRWERFDYGGNAPATLAFAVTLRPEDPNIPAGTPVQEYDQHWSAGDLAAFSPSDDGSELIQVGQRTALAKNANFALLMTSLINAGFPSEQLRKMGDKVKGFDGMVVYMGWQDPPARNIRDRATEGAAAAPAQGNRPRQIAVAQKVISLPGAAPTRPATPAKATRAAATAAPATPAPTPASIPDDATEAEAREMLPSFVGNFLRNAGGRAKKNEVMSAVFKSQVGSAAPVRQRMVQILNTPAEVNTLTEISDEHGVVSFSVEGPDIFIAA